MKRKLLVSLLQKSIEELGMITEGFMEMDEYPTVILQLAKRKTEDIQSILEQLAAVKPSVVSSSSALSEFSAQVSEKNEPKDKPILQASDKTTEVVTPLVSTEDTSEVEPEKEVIEVIELEESPELTAKIDMALANTMQTIELDELDDTTTQVDTIIRSVTQASVVQSTETTPKRKESRVEELLGKTLSDEPKIVTLADKIAPSKISRNEKLSHSDNSLSASLANKKIDDIKQAISIGDRFRFQRELFGGNGEDMNKTLHYINQLSSFEEVVSFLRNKYKWSEEDNDVVDFMQIVKRRF